MRRTLIHRLGAYLKLMRWPNLLMVLGFQLMVWFAWLLPRFSKYEIMPVLSPPQVILLALCTVIITAAGYVVNDLYDIAVDRVNKPLKVIVTRDVSIDSATHFYYFLVVLGGLIAGYLAWYIGHLMYVLIYVVFTLKLWFYSSTLQKRPLTGNLVVALLSALFPLVFLLAEEESLHRLALISPDDYWGIVKVLVVFAVFSFFLSWVRELVKDMEDLEGDRQGGYMTLVVLAGVKRTVAFTSVLLGITAVIVLWWSFTSSRVELIIFGIGMVFSLLYIGVQLQKSRTSVDFARISRSLKGIMLGGMVFLWLHFMLL